MKRLLSLLLALMLCLFLFACNNGSSGTSSGGSTDDVQDGGFSVGNDPALPDKNWD